MSEASKEGLHPKSHVLTSAGATDVGLVRQGNEDSYHINEDSEFYLVADGMGGHKGGAHASKMAVEEITKRFFEFMLDEHADLPTDPVERASESISTAIELANERIHAEAQANPDLKGMGTTLVCAIGLPDAFVVAHVGDSRAYLARGGVVTQVTRDHSLLNLYLDQGLINEEEIDSFPQKNIILRALGRESKSEPETQVISKVPGDILLMCSDGLSDLVDEKTIGEVLKDRQQSLEQMTKTLVRHALQAGGKDNVTVILVETGVSTQPIVDDFDDDATIVGDIRHLLVDRDTQVGTDIGRSDDDTLVGRERVDTDRFARPKQLDEAITQPIDPQEVAKRLENASTNNPELDETSS